MTTPKPLEQGHEAAMSALLRALELVRPIIESSALLAIVDAAVAKAEGK